MQKGNNQKDDVIHHLSSELNRIKSNDKRKEHGHNSSQEMNHASTYSLPILNNEKVLPRLEYYYRCINRKVILAIKLQYILHNV